MNTTIICFIAWVVLQGASLGIAMANNGKEETGKTKAWSTFASLALVALLMYGFGAFDKVFP